MTGFFVGDREFCEVLAFADAYKPDGNVVCYFRMPCMGALNLKEQEIGSHLQQVEVRLSR